MAAPTVADTGARLLAFTRADIERERATTRVEVAVNSAKEAMYAARRAAGTVAANAAQADPTLWEMREIAGLADAFQAIADQLRAAVPAATPNLNEAA